MNPNPDGPSPGPPALRLPIAPRRRPEAAPSEALLLVGDRAAEAAAALLDRGESGGGGPQIFEVAGGLLVIGGGRAIRAASAAGAGMIRLRRVGPRLFVPVDAELSPGLLEDERSGLTRDRGLVFLPGGRVLLFDPARPLPAGLLVAIDRAEARPWRRPPEGPPPRAERIVEVTLERPEGGPDAPLEAAGDGIGTEEPGADAPGGPRNWLGGAALGAGRGMMWVGRKIGLEAISGLGASLAGAAMNLAPRLGEALLGKQEGALRDLLREFREGDVEKALRRALPLGKGLERGASAAGSAELPDRDPSYSLPEILGRAGGGRAGYWFGGFDVQRELIREYHKAAQDAARRGDYRRAAFIYARLLEDYRLAANALLQGGLPRDAALIYLEKLGDRPAAARAFEAAGEFDHALGLYRATEDFERAGDLLSRLGEPDRALACYVEAADRIVSREGDYLKAGELLRSKAGRPDLAALRFAEGWAARPWPNAVGCAVELARLHAEAARLDALRSLVDEADGLLGGPGHEADASRFYNELARLADRPALAEARDLLRDRALVGLAGKLRQRADSGGASPGLVAALFGPARGWSADLIRDAEYALAADRHRAATPDRSGPAAIRGPASTVSRVADGPVTATAFCPRAGLAFLGTGGGDVIRLDLASGESARLGRYAMPVASLAVDPVGSMLAVLWHDGETGRTVLAAYARHPDGSFRMTEGRVETSRSDGDRPYLVPSAADDLGSIALWDGRRYVLLRGSSLTPWVELPRLAKDGGPPPRSALLATSPADPAPVLIELGPPGDWACLAPEVGPIGRLGPPWAPGRPPNSSASAPSVSWAAGTAGGLDLAGVGDDGTLYHTALSLRGDPVGHLRTTGSSPEASYRAAAIVRPRLIAGVGPDAVHWLRLAPIRLVRFATTAIALRSALAAAPSPRTGELVIIGLDGRAERLPVPDR